MERLSISFRGESFPALDYVYDASVQFMFDVDIETRQSSIKTYFATRHLFIFQYSGKWLKIFNEFFWWLFIESKCEKKQMMEKLFQNVWR